MLCYFILCNIFYHSLSNHIICHILNCIIFYYFYYIIIYFVLKGDLGIYGTIDFFKRGEDVPLRTIPDSPW